MSSYSIDHIHLMSQEPLKTAEFYETLFGARRVRTMGPDDSPSMVNVDMGGTTILITKPREDSAPTGLVHFGLKTDNLEAAVVELKGKGVKFTMEITQIGSGAKISFFEAPENVSIELQEGSV